MADTAPEIRFDGASYPGRNGETVLETLLRHGVDVAYSCRKGTCLSCLLKADDGPVPEEAQQGLRDTLRAQNYFLACLCRLDGARAVFRPDDTQVYAPAAVVGLRPLAPAIVEAQLEPTAPLYYHPGQFVNLRRADGVVRSYSLASVPRLEGHLALHVKRLPGGVMSNWIADDLRVGDMVDFQGPNGACFYLPGNPDQPLLLIGTGTGLAPLFGIVRDALNDGHTGEIRLYHGSRHPDGLYLRGELTALAADHSNFRYMPALSGPATPHGERPGRAADIAFAETSDLAGWRVFLCGCPPMVQAARKKAYLAGAALADIHADPFELRDLRTKPRDAA